MQSLSCKKLYSSSGLKATGFGPNLRFLITLIAALALAGCDIASDITTPAAPVAPATDSTAPAEVRSLNAAAGNTQVVLTWTDPANSDFGSVKITQQDRGVEWVVPKGTQTYTVTGLTNDTQYTFTVKTVDTVGNESAGKTATASPAQPVVPDPDYGISLSETETYTFPAATVGYWETRKIVTVNNTGIQATGALTASLTGADSTSFTLSTSGIRSIAVGGSFRFWVSPKTALAVRTSPYTATVTVSGDNGITASFTVSFTVNPVVTPTYSIGLSETGFYTFPAAAVGYGEQTARIVTITNTGNKPSGDFTASLTGAGSTSFTLSPTSLNEELSTHQEFIVISSLEVGGTGSFTVVPKTALAVGTHTATVTVNGFYGITASFTVSFTVNQGSSTFGISLSETGTYTFPADRLPPARTVTVTNTGNRATGALTVSLTGANYNCFDLASTGISSIAAGGTGSFTVVPGRGLRVNTYTATVTVSGGYGIRASFQVSFTVNPEPTRGISLSEIGTYTFPTATVGYGAQTARTVTVYNTGNQATYPLTVSCSSSAGGLFTLSTTGISSIAAGGTGSFTVVPKTGLPVNTYTATVTVSDRYGITASFQVSFKVNQGSPTYGINLSQTGRLDWGKIAVTKVKSETVTITNTGNQPTGTLTITVVDDYLSLMSPTLYADRYVSIQKGSIPAGGTGSFTVYAICRDSTAVNYAKWYTAKVRVSGGNGIAVEFEISYNWDWK
ncbi:hypothetical protein AGMMS49944_17600 [Spirochaetia bacterium]|nr:hypothetical protein AGMMS49944_17600 [Spirochaetia bacterium]